MKARPLEAPRPFPANLRPLVARFAGDASRAAYTAGPATREALARAGAHGATTGSVVHLPGAPSAGMSAELTGVLAHELSHAKQPVGRPRFLLRVTSGAMDADERAAHTVGQQVAAGTDFSTSGGSGTAVHRSISLPTSAGSRGVSIPPPGSVTAGVVDQLPVGGGSGSAVSEARSAGDSFADGLTGSGSGFGTDATARSLLAALAAADPAGAAAAAAHTVGQGAAGEFEGSEQSEAAAAPAGASAAAAPHGAAAAPAAGAGAAAGATAGAAGTRLPDQDIDRIVEAVEQRLLRQLERRGGRYAGVF